MSTLQSAVALIGRALLASIFLVSALPKLFHYADAAAYLATFGVPPQALPVIIAIELGCGLAILVGVLTRPAALLLAVLAVATAVTFHRNIGVDVELVNFMKNIAIAGGLLQLVAYGPGRWAVMPGHVEDADAAPEFAAPAPMPQPGVAQFPPVAAARRR